MPSLKAFSRHGCWRPGHTIIMVRISSQVWCLAKRNFMYLLRKKHPLLMKYFFIIVLCGKIKNNDRIPADSTTIWWICVYYIWLPVLIILLKSIYTLNLVELVKLKLKTFLNFWGIEIPSVLWSSDPRCFLCFFQSHECQAGKSSIQQRYVHMWNRRCSGLDPVLNLCDSI